MGLPFQAGFRGDVSDGHSWGLAPDNALTPAMKGVVVGEIGAATLNGVLGPGSRECCEEGEGKDIEELHLGVIEEWLLRKAKKMVCLVDERDL